MNWTRKDLLALGDLTADEITLILDTAAGFKVVGQRRLKKVPSLRGKTLVNLFVEASTRTRTSFELAAVRLSADVVNITASSSSLAKGESLKDTAKNLEAWPPISSSCVIRRRGPHNFWRSACELE